MVWMWTFQSAEKKYRSHSITVSLAQNYSKRFGLNIYAQLGVAKVSHTIHVK